MHEIKVRDGLLTQQVGEETVIFDPVGNTAHSLDGAASRVWQALESTSDPEVIASRANLSEAQVIGTLERLSELGLIEAPGVSRRTALRRLAVAGAVVAAVELPTIVSLAIPDAAAAQSGGGGLT
jgi:hypothetical protein